ncbi:Transcriptional regulatory protein SrrA [Austwickia sp. TVS 96-490-7B]|uniref:response regulator transcription factor n=1 Tax=Austwickia sp. TVS 96-490-7B TaxID=2830843 RepID=UPI001E144DF3|nr:response regulator transcription factor [Austwickia sp. TVS 96-490-7B]MBW3086552.1 Transcriptional regulatory protein SrrA [Austwickia sp. TVS 96-490-7B]
MADLSRDGSGSKAPVVLVVDDEPRMSSLIGFTLETHGMRVYTAADTGHAWNLVCSHRVDLVVLDVMMPGESGLHFCRRIREQYDIPVILLTALAEIDHRVAGLEAGADDYVSKPFSPRELALRVSAVLRRHDCGDPCGNGAQKRRLGSLSLDLRRHRVTAGGREVHLAPGEFLLLMALSDRVGRTVDPMDLIEAMGHARDHTGAASVVKTAVYRLRAKLDRVEGAPSVVSDRGVGYRLVIPD